MSSDRPSSGKRDWTGAVSIGITLLTSGAVIVSRFSALEEAKRIGIETDREQNARITALENSNAMLERIHRIELENAELHSSVEALREELKELRAKRR